MKKISVKFICLILSLASACLIFTGCKADEESKSQEKESAFKFGDEVLFEDFESYKDISRFLYSKNVKDQLFGDASVCGDHVKTGENSLKLTVGDEPDKPGNVNTAFYVPTTNADGLSFSDFANVYEYSIDAYNATDVEQNATLSLMKNAVSPVILDGQKFKLAPNAWTTLRYKVNHLAIDLSMDVDAVTHFVIGFSGIDTVVHVDNLVVKTTPSAYQTIEIALDDKEVCSFDKQYQELALFGVEVKGVAPIVEINSDLRYVKSGRSAKITIPASNNGAYPYVEFASKMIAKANLSQYKQGGYYLCFDVYKVNEQELTITPRFRSSKTGVYFTQSVKVPSGTGWFEVELDLRDAVTDMDLLWLHFCNNVNYERVFYLDNVRVENKN